MQSKGDFVPIAQCRGLATNGSNQMDPIRAKQLSVALPSFVCWMTGEAITGCHKQDFGPPGHGFSFTDLVTLAQYPVITTICHMQSVGQVRKMGEDLSALLTPETNDQDVQ